MAHDPDTEADLIARARQGDREAYAALVRRYQDVAVATAFLVLRERQDAEDAAQEAFTKAFVALRRFRPDGSFRAWLLRIVANEARTIRGAAQRRAELAARGAAGAPTSPAPSAEAGALAEERRAGLLAALFELPEADRLVVTYRYFFDLSEAEMAEVLGVARGTIKSRLSRALARLRPILRDIGPLVVVGPALDAAAAGAFQELRHTPLGQPSPHLSQAVLARLGDAPVGGAASRLQQMIQQAIQHAFSGSTVAVVGAVVGVALLTTHARTALTDRLRPPPLAPAPQVLVYGGDLSDADRQELRGALGARADAAVMAVSRQELADALATAPADEAISSAALTCQDPSAGLAVRRLHIARVPASAYAGALLTAGVTGASVTVAAPEEKPVSGETALVGLLKAAAACLGHPVDARRVQLAYQQLDLLSTLAGDGPDLNDASERLLRLLDGVAAGQSTDAVLAAEGGPLNDDQRAAASAFLDQLRGLDFGPYARGFHVRQNEPVEGSYAILPNG